MTHTHTHVYTNAVAMQSRMCYVSCSQSHHTIIIGNNTITRLLVDTTTQYENHVEEGGREGGREGERDAMFRKRHIGRVKVTRS